MADDAVKVGGPYVEDENFVPNPTDQMKQYNTSGLGAHQRIEEVANIFEVDKVKTAEQIVAALDEDDPSVDASRVVLPSATDDNDAARERVLKAAQARVKQGVVIGEPGPAEREAAEETAENARAEGQADGKSVRPAKESSTTKSDSDDKAAAKK